MNQQARLDKKKLKIIKSNHTVVKSMLRKLHRTPSHDKRPWPQSNKIQFSFPKWKYDYHSHSALSYALTKWFVIVEMSRHMEPAAKAINFPSPNTLLAQFKWHGICIPRQFPYAINFHFSVPANKASARVVRTTTHIWRVQLNLILCMMTNRDGDAASRVYLSKVGCDRRVRAE